MAAESIVAYAPTPASVAPNGALSDSMSGLAPARMTGSETASTAVSRVASTAPRDGCREPSALAALTDDPSFIGSSDQACKECRRRKARCNKALPTCDLCVRYRRHCLYEKHARTPLTRRHLTELEARLERTEALLRRMRSLVPAENLSALESGTSQQPLGEPPFSFNSAPTNGTANGTPTGQGNGQLNESQLAQTPAHQVETPRRQSTAPQDALAPGHPHSVDSRPLQPAPPLSGPLPGTGPGSASGPGTAPVPLNALAYAAEAADHRMLEGPPQDDFEWCEKEATRVSGLSPDGGVSEAADDESPASDGMASLAVNDRDTGYLGVASGAALLRLLEPQARRRRASSRSHAAMTTAFSLTPQPNPNRHISEAMIDAYFRLYHVSYPILHEPTFRAQYSEVIPRPNGACWTVLAYVVAAIGVWASATNANDTLDMALFAQARSMLGFDFLEVGNLTLVQALTLVSNYQQKRDKPNSGYNYLGLAGRMAMGLGLHKEFQGWNISLLNMEIRRRVWWSLCVFDVGATITFSRPDVWPYNGIDVRLPLNVNDKDLTAASTVYPPESPAITPYTAVAAQARFHVATRACYERVISKPFPSAAELLHLDAERIEPWQAGLPPCFAENAVMPARYAMCHAVMAWRLRNLRILMYRPYVIRRALRRRPDTDEASTTAYDRCLADAKSTIQIISDYWEHQDHNRLAAWYGLYFLFQAALIPVICLRNDPSAAEAPDWRTQIKTTLQTIAALAPTNASSGRCYRVISGLCARYLDMDPKDPMRMMEPMATQQQQQPSLSAGMAAESQLADPGINTGGANAWTVEQPVGESPQTQINNVFAMMWPNMPALEAADVVMGDDAGWMEFLRAGSMDDWSRST